MPDPLTDLLSLYPAPSRPLGPIHPLGRSASGARLWRFDSGLGPLVARAWPADGPGPSALAHIHGWLARLAILDFIPVPLATRDGRTLVLHDGLAWELAPWRPGAADPARPPARPRLRAMFAGLAAVHQRLAPGSDRGPSPGLGARLAEAESLIREELAALAPILDRSPPDPVRATSLRWLALARDGLPPLAARLRREAAGALPLQPVLRDARAEHFLFEGDRLAGLVDFGAMGVDSPATDLARLLGEAVGPDRDACRDALDAYTAVRPLEPIELSRLDLFAESAAWLGPARWIRWHYLERRRFDDPNAVRLGLERTFARLLERLP